MMIPYNTDAPLYHWPFATGGLIVLNIIAFIWECSAGLFSTDTSQVEALCLQYGTINPIQWVTSIFMHADPIHLIGNMLFLWTFGLIVEGKVGWWRFLAIFIGIGILQCAAEQVIGLLVGEGLSLGASSAIFGIMAVALVWAPYNEVHAFVLIVFFVMKFEITVLALAAFYLVTNVLTVIFTGASISSGFLHLMGAAIGFPIGVLMVTMRRVDCEGFDVISMLQGKAGQKVKTRQDEKLDKASAEVYEIEKRDAMEKGQQQFELYLQQGHIDMALARFNVLKNYDKTMRMTDSQLNKLIRAHHKEKRWRDSIVYMKEYIQRGAKSAPTMHLKMAQIFLIEFERPRLVLETLGTLDQATLKPEHRKLAQQMVAKSKWMIEEGHLEVDDEL